MNQWLIPEIEKNSRNYVKYNILIDYFGISSRARFDFVIWWSLYRFVHNLCGAGAVKLYEN